MATDAIGSSDNNQFINSYRIYVHGNKDILGYDTCNNAYSRMVYFDIICAHECQKINVDNRNVKLR